MHRLDPKMGLAVEPSSNELPRHEIALKSHEPQGKALPPDLGPTGSSLRERIEPLEELGRDHFRHTEMIGIERHVPARRVGRG